MQFKQLVTDEDAVSPVIGVILMVAITVILAAVIASFVLGLGGTEDPAPTPMVEWSQDGDQVTIDITGGDAFDPSEVELHSNVISDSDQNGAFLTETIDEADISSSDELSAGDDITIDVTGHTDDWEIQLIWNPADQDPEIVISNEA